MAFGDDRITGMSTKRTHPGRAGHKLAMPGVTLDQALRAALLVKPADVKKLEEQEAAEKRAKRRAKR